MNPNFLAYQAQEMAQLHSSKIASSMRHSKESSSSSEIPTQSSEDNHVSILKDINNKSDTPSHIRHINIPNELLNSMKEQRLENNLSMPEHDLTMYEDETTTIFTSFPICQVQTVDTKSFCVDTGASNSCVGDKALEKIVLYSGRRSIPIIDS